MIVLKSASEIEKMQKAGAIAAAALSCVVEAIKEGVSTRELDKLAEEYILSQDARPAFKGYRGFPASICASVNEEVVHGIPGSRKIRRGDLVSIDVGVEKEGYCADMATTVMVGEVPQAVKTMVETARESLQQGIALCRPGKKIGDIANRIQSYVEAKGFSVVRALAGHGIGRDMHEDPEVPNFGEAGFGVTLRPGMVLAIEPMVNLGTYEVFTKADQWTVVTADEKPSAHFEHTVAVTKNGPLVLTELKK